MPAYSDNCICNRGTTEKNIRILNAKPALERPIPNLTQRGYILFLTRLQSSDIYLVFLFSNDTVLHLKVKEN